MTTCCDHCLPVDTTTGTHYLDCVLDTQDGHTTHQTADGRHFAIHTADGTPFTP